MTEPTPTPICPDWCAANHARSGWHYSRALWADEFGHALQLSKSSDDGGEGGAYIELHTGSGESIPRSLLLPAVAARALAAALLDAAEAREASLPGRCRCGEPIPAEHGVCLICEVKMRRGLRAVTGGES
jgi:hypothetical protein